VRGLGPGVAATLSLLLVACSGDGPSPSPTPTAFRGAASSYLLGLDQIHVAGFVVQEAAHSVGPQSAAADDAQLALALRAAGMQDGATVRYFRDVSDLGTANGFVDVRSTVLRFADAGAAHRGYLAEVRHTDAVPSLVPESTDVLGDESHSGQIVATSPEGVQVVEVTVVMRHANLVEVLVVRGRLGGTSQADALVLAHTWLTAQR
jgi:hypothetical protein